MLPAKCFNKHRAERDSGNSSKRRLFASGLHRHTRPSSNGPRAKATAREYTVHSVCSTHSTQYAIHSQVTENSIHTEKNNTQYTAHSIYVYTVYTMLHCKVHSRSNTGHAHTVCSIQHAVRNPAHSTQICSTQYTLYTRFALHRS